MVVWKIVIPVAILIVVILTGTFVYHNLEGWRYLDSAFFSVITVTTIGYGDFSPQTDAGKIFTMFFAFSGIGIAFYVISLAGRYMLRRQTTERLRALGRIKNNRGVKKIKAR